MPVIPQGGGSGGSAKKKKPVRKSTYVPTLPSPAPTGSSARKPQPIKGAPARIKNRKLMRAPRGSEAAASKLSRVTANGASVKVDASHMMTGAPKMMGTVRQIPKVGTYRQKKSY